MNNQFKELIKKTLPGLLPIFVFILAEWIWSAKIGIAIALVFGIIQFTFICLKYKKIDKFILADTLVLCVFGLISIAFENEIFFKLKPLLINIILVAILGFSAFSKNNLILKYSQRFINNTENSSQIEKLLKNQLKILFWIFILHSILILYSAFYMSNEAWAFISGILIYIFIGIYFIAYFIYMRIKTKKNKNIEWLPWIDENANIIGKVDRNIAVKDKKYLHPVVHMHIINNQNQLYLQKRSKTTEVEPNKWDTAIGGHVSFGETIEQALIRESKEEMNLQDFESKFITKYFWETKNEKELVFSFICRYNSQITPNLNEVQDGKFWDLNEIEENIGKNIFTPNLEKELPDIMNIIREKMII